MIVSQKDAFQIYNVNVPFDVRFNSLPTSKNIKTILTYCIEYKKKYENDLDSIEKYVMGEKPFYSLQAPQVAKKIICLMDGVCFSFQILDTAICFPTPVKPCQHENCENLNHSISCLETERLHAAAMHCLEKAKSSIRSNNRAEAEKFYNDAISVIKEMHSEDAFAMKIELLRVEYSLMQTFST